MIFHDIIPPEKFHVGQQCKIITSGLTVIISEIEDNSIGVVCHKYDGIVKFTSVGIYCSEIYNGINDISSPLKEIVMKRFILNRVCRIIPL